MPRPRSIAKIETLFVLATVEVTIAADPSHKEQIE
jgi:hypothetical protein